MLSLKKLKRSCTRFHLNFKYAFTPKKPLLIFRLLQAYSKLFLFRQIPLRYVDVAVGYGCNLSCLHCSAAKFSKDDTARLTFEDYKHLGQQCLNLGVITVGFTGGEPTLYPDLDKTIRAFQPNKIMVSLITNGTLLNEQKILHYKKLGVDILCMSIDSFDRQEHDAFRRSEGAYQRTMHNLKIALQKNLKVVMVTTISHQNLHSESIQQLIRFTQEKNILLIFSLACPAGRWSTDDEQILLNEDDIAYMNQLFLKYPHLRRDFESNWFTSGCGAGNEKLYFTPYGDVIPCPFIHISFGNVKDTPLKVIRKRMLQVPELAGYPQKCLSGEDLDFSRKYVVPANTSKKIPVDYKVVFSEELFKILP